MTKEQLLKQYGYTKQYNSAAGTDVWSKEECWLLDEQISTMNVNELREVLRVYENCLITLDNELIRHLKPIKVTENQVEVLCPYCGEVHCHGKVEGHRVSHCDRDTFNQGYYIDL